MPGKRIVITLSRDDQQVLETYVSHGQKKAREINRARILLLSNAGRQVKDIAKVLGVSKTTVSNVRKRYQQQASPPIVDFLQEEPRSGRPITLDSKVEAQVTMIACSDPPRGPHVGPSISLQTDLSRLMPLRVFLMKVSEVC